jgi:diguanylate cyclase (GGDEF)-like protein
MLGHRSNDAVITICQDNGRHAIEIRELNKPAEDVLGFNSATVSGRPLMHFLPERIQTLLKEYVEYDDDGNDVGIVLSKVQSFCIVNNEGKEVAFRLKVLRSESLDKNAYFRLILQDRSGGRQNEAFRAALRDNFKGHEVLEPHTGLPDRGSLVKDLELVHYYVNKEALRACTAVVEIDRFQDVKGKHGEDAVYDLLKHVAGIARQNLRGDDTIGCIGPDRLGILIMDTNPESARMVLNRLRWLIAAAPLALENRDPIPATVSIAFARVSQQTQEKDILGSLEASLAAPAASAGNALVEVAG